MYIIQTKEEKEANGGNVRLVFFPLFFTSVQDPDQDPDPIDLQDFGSLYPYPKKYADPRIWIKGSKYQPKTAKKTILLSNPKSELSKKERI